MLPHLGLVLGRAELFYEDHRRFTLPTAELASEALCHGRLPGWNPFAGVGRPLLADRPTLALYPGMALACVLPPNQAIAVLLVFQLALLAAGLCGLLLELGVRPPIAVGAGAAFALCGPAASWMSSAPCLVTLSFFPWVLLAAHRMGRRSGLGPAVGLGAAIGLGTLGGDVPGALVQAAVALALVLAVGGWRRTGPWLLGAGALAVVIGAATWVPLAWYEGLADRAGRWSMNPIELVGLLVPNPLGLPLSENTFWAFAWLGEPRLFVHSYYFGALLAGFGLAGAIGLRRECFFAAAAISALVLLILATGATTPLWAVLQVVFRYARYPSQIAPAALLLIAVLGAVTLSRALERLATGLWLTVAIGAVVAVGALAGPSLQSVFAGRAGALPEQVTLAAEQLRAGAIVAIALTSLAALTFLLARRYPRRFGPRAALVLGAVLVTDGLVAGTELWWIVDQPLGVGPPPWVPERPGPGARVLRTAEIGTVSLHRDLTGYLREAMRQERLLIPRSNATRRIGVLEGHGLALYHEDPLAVVEVTGIDVVVMPPGRPPRWVARGLSEARLVPVRSLYEGGVVLRPTQALPRAYTATAYQVVARDAELARIAQGGYRQGPVITDGEALEDGRLVTRSTSLVLKEVPSRPGAIQTVPFGAWSTESMRFELDRAEPSLLVVTDAFIAGWRATVDGQPAPMLRANGMGRAVPVPGGRHLVEMWFDVLFLRAAVLASVLGLLAALAAALVVARRPVRL